MSDLQIGLILMGVVLILAVLVFNWWQDRRIRQKMQHHFPEREQDPLMGGPQGAYPTRREPAFAAPAGGHVESDIADDSTDDPDEIDPSTEVVIDISFAQPVESIELYSAVQSMHRVGSKPVRVFAESDGGLHRARLRAGESYVSMQLAVLLANRSGALTDIEWSQLWTFAQGLAERFDGSVEGPETQEVLRRAQELDALCAGLDAQAGLVLQLPGPQSADQVTRMLENIGFLYGETQLAWMSDTGVARFTVLFDGQPPMEKAGDEITRLDFVLDLPNSPADRQAFSRMATVGRDLARRFDAVLLDDQGRPLPDHSDDAIDGQLHDLYTRLEQAGYPAGEARAARVFS